MPPPFLLDRCHDAADVVVMREGSLGAVPLEDTTTCSPGRMRHGQTERVNPVRGRFAPTIHGHFFYSLLTKLVPAVGWKPAAGLIILVIRKRGHAVRALVCV